MTKKTTVQTIADDALKEEIDSIDWSNSEPTQKDYDDFLQTPLFKDLKQTIADAVKNQDTEPRLDYQVSFENKDLPETAKLIRI